MPPRRTARGGRCKVCKKPRCYNKIQEAIDAAGKGTRSRSANGTYKEGVQVLKGRRRTASSIGNPKNPGKVVLERQAA